MLKSMLLLVTFLSLVVAPAALTQDGGKPTVPEGEADITSGRHFGSARGAFRLSKLSISIGRYVMPLLTIQNPDNKKIGTMFNSSEEGGSWGVERIIGMTSGRAPRG